MVAQAHISKVRVGRCQIQGQPWAIYVQTDRNETKTNQTRQPFIFLGQAVRVPRESCFLQIDLRWF